MYHLMIKEFKIIRPYLYFSIIFGMLDVLFAFLVEYPDQIFLSHKILSFLNSQESYSIFYLIIGFSLAFTLIIREYEENSIEFLDSLPVKKVRIFLSKILISFIILLTAPFISILFLIIVRLISYQSIDPSFYSGILFKSFISHLFLIYSISGWTFLLIYLRRFGWLASGIIFWIYLYLSKIYPGLDILNLFRIIDPTLKGTSLLIPWKIIFLHFSLSSIMLYLSYRVFSGSADKIISIYEKFSKTRRGNVVLFITAILIVGLSISIMMQIPSNSSDSPNKVRVFYPEYPASRASTNYFDFIFYKNIESKVLSFVSIADSLRKNVYNLLGDGTDERIYVDLTRNFNKIAGTAEWQTINMEVSAWNSINEISSIFSHELTHVYIDAVSDMRLHDKFRYTRFFHEGLASYVEYKIRKSKEKYDMFRFISAAQSKRDKVKFWRLIDNDALLEYYDDELAYHLGETFIRALVKKYGKQAPTKIVKTFNRPDIIRDLEGFDLWYDVFQTSGYNLESVISEYEKILKKEQNEFKAKINALPDISTVVNTLSDDIQIKPALDTIPPGWKLICRIRQNKNASTEDYIDLDMETNMFSFSKYFVSDRHIEYQVGLQHLLSGEKIYENWISINI